MLIKSYVTFCHFKEKNRSTKEKKSILSDYLKKESTQYPHTHANAPRSKIKPTHTKDRPHSQKHQKDPI